MVFRAWEPDVSIQGGPAWSHDVRYAEAVFTFDAWGNSNLRFRAVCTSAEAARALEGALGRSFGEADLQERAAECRGLIGGLLGGHAQAATMGIVGFLVLDRLGLRATPELGAGPTGMVLMAGALATLLAQWGIIPMWHLGPRASCLWGMALAGAGVALLSVASNLHAIIVGMGLASLGFGLFRPGFTSGASLAVTRAEQGQSAGIVASVNGAAYIVAPAIGVWLYGHSSWIGFGVIEALCAGAIILGIKGMAGDEALLERR